MTLELNLKTKIITFIVLICYSTMALADPEINGELVPPGEAMYVTDPDILSMLNLGPDGEPIWCYSNLANSLIITSADREREKCQLKCKQDISRMAINYTFEIDQLQIQIDSLKQEHQEVLQIKNNQIDKLTQATMEIPNDNSIWWATGGAAAGVLATLAIMFAVR